MSVEVKPHLVVEPVLEALPPDPGGQQRQQTREHVTPCPASRGGRLHRSGQPFPACRVLLEPPPSGAGQPVVLGAAPVLALSAFRLDEALMLQPVERGIERALRHVEGLFRDLPNPQQHPVAAFPRNPPSDARPGNQHPPSETAPKSRAASNPPMAATHRTPRCSNQPRRRPTAWPHPSKIRGQGARRAVRCHVPTEPNAPGRPDAMRGAQALHGDDTHRDRDRRPDEDADSETLRLRRRPRHPGPVPDEPGRRPSPFAAH